MIKYNITENKVKYIDFSKEISKTKFMDNLVEISEKIKERIGREVPDTGYFRSFAEDCSINNKNIYGRSVSICVERDETANGSALLLVSLLHPVLNKEASKMLTYGNREALLKHIENPNFKEELEKTVLELSESLKQQG